jgi:tetratricopeptide (TPR) repeat protein
VFGGQGKAVWLGAGNKVPVVKLRWKAAPPPVKEPLAEEPVSLASFLRRLESMTSPRATARSAIEELEGHVGVAMAPDLRAFFAFHESRALHASVGQLRIWTEPTWGLPDSRSVERLASSVYREAASAIAALTNTIYLGADRGGQVYFAEIDPKRSEVFVYGPGVGELKLLCDSFASFAELNEIDERWQACCEDEGVDEDDLEREEFVLASPRLRALREEIRLRRGRFHLTGFDHSDVSTDFDETIPRLGGTKLEAVSRSCTSRLFNGARWLVWLLSGSHVHVEPAGARDLDADMRDPELAPLAATKVYWLWHLFLFDRRTELGTFLEVCARDPSRLVRTTAELMSELSVPGPVRAPLEHFRELRSVVLDAAAGRVRPLPKERGLRVEEERREKRLRELVAPAPSDSPRIAAQKKAVAKALHEPQPWDALTFAYFEEEDVERMLAATEARLTLSHGDYYPWLQKGIALQMLKRYPEALAAFDRALFLERENAWASAWINKSFVCGALGDRSGALLHLREALRIHPEHKQVARESDELAPYRGEPEFRALLEG